MPTKKDLLQQIEKMSKRDIVSLLQIHGGGTGFLRVESEINKSLDIPSKYDDLESKYLDAKYIKDIAFFKQVKEIEQLKEQFKKTSKEYKTLQKIYKQKNKLKILRTKLMK